MTDPRLRGRRMWVVAMALVLARFVAACGEEKEEASGGGDCVAHFDLLDALVIGRPFELLPEKHRPPVSRWGADVQRSSSREISRSYVHERRAEDRVRSCGSV